MRVTIVMCEGPHDVAFMSRIMHADGYHTYNEVINDYPAFVSKFIKGFIIKGSLSDLNLKAARGGLFLPSFSLFKDENLLLLYQLQGDSKKDGRRVIVSDFDLLFTQSIAVTSGLLTADDSLSVVYVYDADNKGVGKRINEINSELSEFLNPDKKMSVVQAGFDYYHGIKYGAYVFHIPDDADGHGRLEDMVVPLMSQSNSDIRNDVDILVGRRETRQYGLFSEKSKKKDKDFDTQKATIGIMGQLQKSGSPNATIIEQSSFITDEQILNDKACIEIISFVNASFA